MIQLQPDIEKVLKELGYIEFTEIQEKTIPLIQQGKDVIGQSMTGSGKTAAFGLPILEKITHMQGLQVLILVPTRELCNQDAKEMRKFARYKKMNIVEIYGGVSIEPQIHGVRTADIVVGTPGRILDHLQRGTVSFAKVKILVLDEADKMFEMGFIEDIHKIISQVPKQRQTLLFSATVSEQVHEIARNYMHNPERVKVQSYVEKGRLVQQYYDVDPKDKFSLLVHLIKKHMRGLVMVFCATRHMVDALSKNLSKQGIQAMPLHGGLTQNKRKTVLDMFHANKLDVLVASDVAARGLDIKNVSHIVNYDIPKTSQEYIHRIGRTARAGSEGKVVSLLAYQDHDNFRRVLEDRSLIVEKLECPTFERLHFERPQRGFRPRPWQQGRQQGQRRFGQGNRNGPRNRRY